MQYYYVFRIFCYKMRIPLTILYIMTVVSACIGAYIKNGTLYAYSCLIGIIFALLFTITWETYPYKYVKITSNIKVKPRKLRKLTIEIIKQLEQLNQNKISFTFKEYTVYVIGMRNRCSLLEPHVERIYFRNEKIFRAAFRIFPDGDIVTLNEFFYKTVTKDDKLELQKVLFQLI